MVTDLQEDPPCPPPRLCTAQHSTAQYNPFFNLGKVPGQLLV